MASFQKFNATVQDFANKVHNLSADQLTIALTLVAPVAANSVRADLTEVSYTNLSSRNITTVSSVQTAGIEKLICSDLTLTASGAVAPFRYVVIYNSTAAGNPLIGFYDAGATVTMSNSGDTFLIDFDQSNGVLTIQ